MQRSDWLLVPVCVVGLVAGTGLASAQQQGGTSQDLKQQAQQKAQEAKDLARQTQEKAQEARSESAQEESRQKAEEAKGLARETQEKAQEARELAAQSQQQQQQINRLNQAGLFRASNLVGMDVHSRDNQHVGKIQDLTIDSKNGRIAYAAIASGNKLVAVPWNSLQLHSDQQGNRFAMLNVQQGDFQKAPAFSENQWPTSQNQIWQVGTEHQQGDTNAEQQKQMPQQQQGPQAHEQQQKQPQEQQSREQQQKQQQEQQAREQQQREQQQKQHDQQMREQQQKQQQGQQKR